MGPRPANMPAPAHGPIQPNMGQPVHRQPMMTSHPPAKNRSTHEIVDLRNDFRSPEDCRDRLTTYFVFRIEPVDSNEAHTVEGDELQSTWMNAHVIEAEDLPRKEILRQIRQLNKASEEGVAEKKKGMGPGQQRQIEKVHRKLEVDELSDPAHFEITLVQLDDTRRELTDKKYRNYDKKMKGGSKAAAAATTSNPTLFISKPNGQIKKKKKKMQKRVSITAIFKCAPKSGVDVEKLLKKREDEDLLRTHRMSSAYGSNLVGVHQFPPGPNIDQPGNFVQGHTQGQFPHGQQPQPGPFNPGLGPGPRPSPHPIPNGRPPPQPRAQEQKHINWGKSPPRRKHNEISSTDSYSSASNGSSSCSEDDENTPTSHGSYVDGGRHRRRQRDPKKYTRGSEYQSGPSINRRRGNHNGEYTCRVNDGRGRNQARSHRRQPERILPHVPNAPTYVPAPIIVQQPMMHYQHQQPMVPAIDIQEALHVGRIRGKVEEARLMEEATIMGANWQLPDGSAARPRYLPLSVRMAEAAQAHAANVEIEEQRGRIAAAVADAVARERSRVKNERIRVENEWLGVEEDRRATEARAAYYHRQQQQQAERYEEEYLRDLEWEDREYEARRAAMEQDRERRARAQPRNESPDDNPFLRPTGRRRPTAPYRHSDAYHFT